MNVALMEYLRDQGYASGAINERVKLFLANKVGGSAASTIEELWLRMGAMFGYGSDLNQIQKNWAQEVSGVTGTWNDNFRALPGFNLVTNSSFLVDALGWLLGTGWSQIAGFAVKIAGSTADLTQSTVIPIPGETYRITYTLSVTAGIFMARIGNSSGPNRTTSGTYTDDIVAVNSIPFSIRGGSTAIGSVTDISVRRLGA